MIYDRIDLRDMRNHREPERTDLAGRLLQGMVDFLRCSVCIFLLMLAFVVIWKVTPGTKTVDEVLGIEPQQIVAEAGR